jgi:hypothetical protein
MGAKGKKLNDLPFKRDASGEVINAGQSIVDILNSALTSGVWTPVGLSGVDKMACKSILAGMRDGSNWKLSHLSNGARYRTVRGTLSIDMAKEKEEVLFYAQSSAASGTLEVILLD